MKPLHKNISGGTNTNGLLHTCHQKFHKKYEIVQQTPDRLHHHTLFLQTYIAKLDIQFIRKKELPQSLCYCIEKYGAFS